MRQTQRAPVCYPPAMSTSVMRQAFAHHVWATSRLIEACASLGPEQLATAIPGTYGSIEATLRHIVDSDSFDLFAASNEGVPFTETASMSLRQLRLLMETSGAGWTAILDSHPDPQAMVLEVDPDDGFTRDASLGMRLAQAIHHASDHRTQVCFALTTLGIEPPPIGVWDFGAETGAVTEVYPPKN